MKNAVFLVENAHDVCSNHCTLKDNINKFYGFYT